MKEKLLIYLKGMGMGAADVVPGVSGGTVAFITGIYERLLNAIGSVDADALRMLLRFDIKGIWKKVDGNFLLPLLAGIFTSVLTLAKLMKYLLETHPILLWSFFFGLIIASAVIVSRQIKHWNAGSIIAIIVGTVAAYYISVLSPSEAPEGLPFVFLSGCIAICAMILPGISGSFILLLMGQYQRIMQAISDFDITKLAVFGMGCLVGILSFSRVLSFLLKRYHDATVALLTGFMIGSLNKVWPWKEVLEYYTNRHGEMKPLVEQNVSPMSFAGDPQLMLAVVLAIGGFVFVYGLEKFAMKKA
ncbi:DUF368 domain-containing protein [Limibacter armeniacum]|uniref:DUF368 domain-containing protein n=1 Tax=Limibacter armeniacum TaxID=466084 RepID=UPI002FE69C64